VMCIYVAFNLLSHNNLQHFQFFRPVRTVSCRFLQQSLQYFNNARTTRRISLPTPTAHLVAIVFSRCLHCRYLSRLLLRDL